MENKIPIIPADLEYQKIISISECYLLLADKYIIWKCEFECDEPIDDHDLELGWKRSKKSWKTIALKNKIAGADMSRFNDNPLWGIYIKITGFEYDIKIHVNKKSEAQSIFEAIQEYILI